MSRISGVLFVKIDGVQRDIIGDWTYNLGANKNEMLVGPDKRHGHKSLPQVPFVEGEIRDASDLDVEALLNIVNSTITLELANGKTIVFSQAVYAGDGDIGTEEANIQVRFESLRAEEI